jgi:hypothetical protein
VPHADVPDARSLAVPVLRLQDGLLRVVDHASAQALIDAWCSAVVTRHTARFSRPEFLKAVRALSGRYVERRHSLPTGAALDSAGKRAAFAGFFAPLHLLTMRQVARALFPCDTPSAARKLIDLGCGTGVASAALALGMNTTAVIDGIDLNRWTLAELRWNFAQLRVRGRPIAARMTDWLEQELHQTQPRLPATTIVCGWSVNELTDQDRRQLLPLLLEAHHAGCGLLVVEPLSRSAVPWWPQWSDTFQASGGRSDEWRFAPDLPPLLADLDEAAGFDRETLGARSIWLAPAAARQTSAYP